MTKSERSTRAFSTAVILTLLVAASACAPTMAGTLKGPGGEPVSAREARVNISRLDSGTQSAVIVVEVKEDGSWSTDADLAEGSYLVEALVPGYGLESKTVKLGESDGVELTLKALPPAKTTAIGANVEADAARGAGGATLTPPNM